MSEKMSYEDKLDDAYDIYTDCLQHSIKLITSELERLEVNDDFTPDTVKLLKKLKKKIGTWDFDYREGKDE